MYWREPGGGSKESDLYFIRESNLPEKKLDFRLYGFNNPSLQEGRKEYGYEFWVTIPEDMEVKPPIEIKQFDGGVYAAYCINFGDFNEWELFVNLTMRNWI